jgi:hypothetical protein
VYKLDSFVGFIGDEQLHAQECYDPSEEHGFHLLAIMTNSDENLFAS